MSAGNNNGGREFLTRGVDIGWSPRWRQFPVDGSHSRTRSALQRCCILVLLITEFGLMAEHVIWLGPMRVLVIEYSVAPATEQLGSFGHPYSHVVWGKTRASNFFRNEPLTIVLGFLLLFSKSVNCCLRLPDSTSF